MPVTLVLNSYYFIEEIIPGTLQELAKDTFESHLFQAIRNSGHRMLVTERGGRASIKREYQNEAVRMGLGPQLIVVLDHLNAQGNMINSNVARRPIRNLGGRHEPVAQTKPNYE